MTDTRARGLHESAIVIDAISPLLAELGPKAAEAWQRGGATVASPLVALNEDAGGALASIARWQAWFREYPNLLHIETVDDISRAKAEGRLGILFHFQNTTPLDRNVELVDAFHRLGLRLMQLTYNQTNAVGGGCADREDVGLTDFGVAVIAEMNRVGIVVDCSHTGERTTLQAVDQSSVPVVVSHSNATSVHRNRRNVSDDVIKAVASRGGLVGANALSPFISSKQMDRVTIDDLLVHVDHMVQLVGPDHVGLGLDFYSGGTPDEYAELVRRGEWNTIDLPPCPHTFPVGLSDPSMLWNLTEGLSRRGYADEGIRSILGGNWMRIFRTVWTRGPDR